MNTTKHRNKFKVSTAKKKLDKVFSAYILERDNRTCIRCGKNTGKMDTMHLIPKEILATRWLPEAACCACPRCHRFGTDSYHQNVLATHKWLKTHYGEEYLDRLLELSKKTVIFDQEQFNSIYKSYEYNKTL
jgi:5-methylcytosine-specific restriction endonuclease McrA